MTDQPSHLNNHLKMICSGLCLLPLVQDILRFRIGETAVVADIQQAFLQISIAEPHRNLPRFLWLEDINNSDVIKTFRFAHVMFGSTCSPFLLYTSITAHVEKLWVKIQKNYFFNSYDIYMLTILPLLLMI